MTTDTMLPIETRLRLVARIIARERAPDRSAEVRRVLLEVGKAILMSGPTIVSDRVPIEIRAEAQRVVDETGAAYEDLPRITAALCHLAFMRDTERLRDEAVADVARRYGFELPDGAAIRAEV